MTCSFPNIDYLPQSYDNKVGLFAFGDWIFLLHQNLNLLLRITHRLTLSCSPTHLIYLYKDSIYETVLVFTITPRTHRIDRQMSMHGVIDI